MSDLGPEARAILDAAQGGDDPTDADRRRVHSSIARRVGVGAAILGTTATTSATAGGATIVAGVTSMTKVVLLVVGLVGAVGGGAYVVHRVTAPKSTTVATTKPTPVIAPAPIPMPDPTPMPAPMETVAAPTPTPTPTVAPAPIAIAAASETKKSSFDDELALMQKAQAALGAGNPQGALALLDEGAKRFPNGALSEERVGMRVLALCEIGRSDARAQAETFLAAHPSAPMAEHIRSACGIAK